MRSLEITFHTSCQQSSSDMEVGWTVLAVLRRLDYFKGAKVDPEFGVYKDSQSSQFSLHTLQKQSGCFNHRVVAQVGVSWRTVVMKGLLW